MRGQRKGEVSRHLRPTSTFVGDDLQGNLHYRIVSLLDADSYCTKGVGNTRCQLPMEIRHPSSNFIKPTNNLHTSPTVMIGPLPLRQLEHIGIGLALFVNFVIPFPIFPIDNIILNELPAAPGSLQLLFLTGT